MSRLDEIAEGLAKATSGKWTTENPGEARVADLLPCPFCGGAAKREDIEGREGVENAGASYITCTRCWASTALHFGRKENLDSSWNDRHLASVAEQSGAGAPRGRQALRLALPTDDTDKPADGSWLKTELDAATADIETWHEGLRRKR